MLISISGRLSPTHSALRRPRRAAPAWAASAFLLLALVAAGCRRSDTANAAPAEAAPLAIDTATAVEQPITRFIRASGTLMAQDDAEVAAEIAGRVVSTPVERGTQVRMGAELIRIAAAEVEAQAQEADANVAQIQARLGLDGAAGGPESGGSEGPPLRADGVVDVERVPEVAAARATHDLAQADFNRTKMLQEKELISRSEFDIRQAQVETSRRQYETARNSALQQHQALAAARARATLARKALTDTVVRAPFDGVVAERTVSVGDYVTRGTKVATVMRINPLRVELTVPAQHMAAVAAGREVTFSSDAYPGQTFTGQVRYVSPDVRADSRALVVEAIVPNRDNTLKPGLFATALIEESSTSAGILVPAAAVRTVGGTSRVFVVAGDHVEERIVTVSTLPASRGRGGQSADQLVEIASGVTVGDVVATSHVNQLVDGTRVSGGSAKQDPPYADPSSVGRVLNSGPAGAK